MGLGKEHGNSRFDKMLKIGHLIGVLGRLIARFRHFSGIRVFSLGIRGISLGHHYAWSCSGGIWGCWVKNSDCWRWLDSRDESINHESQLISSNIILVTKYLEVS